MRKNKEIPTGPVEKESASQFEEGDIITCPSDLTGNKWVVTGEDGEGIHAKILEQLPDSSKYPREIIIKPQAQADWKKIGYWDISS